MHVVKRMPLRLKAMSRMNGSRIQVQGKNASFCFVFRIDIKLPSVVALFYSRRFFCFVFSASISLAVTFRYFGSGGFKENVYRKTRELFESNRLQPSDDPETPF